ncbi:UNVERIFIED_CONTAM: hypothetical protein HDU68_001127, partial [Siphonaria sp. JEL0065]
MSGFADFDEPDWGFSSSISSSTVKPAVGSSSGSGLRSGPEGSPSLTSNPFAADTSSNSSGWTADFTSFPSNARSSLDDACSTVQSVAPPISTATSTWTAFATTTNTEPPLPVNHSLKPPKDDDTISVATTTNTNPNKAHYDTFSQDDISEPDRDRDSFENSPPRVARQPVITKSHQLSHITSIFNDSQKIAYVGLCYLEIHSRKEARLANAGKHAQQGYHEWADRFMRMLYAFLDVSEAEQQMIANLALHGLVPSDLSRTLLDDAQKALERLQ